MLINERQLMLLIMIAKDSFNVQGVIGGLQPQQRVTLINEILAQQGNDFINIKSLGNEKPNKRDGT